MWPSCGLMLAIPGTDYAHCVSMHYRIWGFLPYGKLRAERDWRVGHPGSCQGRKAVTGIIGNMVLINSGFHTRDNLSENIPQLRHAPSGLFGSPILGRKNLKNIDLKRRRIINLPGAPTCLGPSLVVRRGFVFVYRRFGTAKGELLHPYKVGMMGCFTIR